MSRAPISDEDLYVLADAVDLWLVSSKDCGPMRSLREAVHAAASHSDPVRLYRPPSIGAASIWIESDQIRRLETRFAEDARRYA